ncbi:hypothetical protein LR48_Vigan11g120200 [Vigna angularis]|uniref:Uncharacterized protein n=1 Tax=Phaseolus angularis TaxID=3914 RepID=A0A0L9VT93_PHAAN|nr:hypothetical protein LR48_Vigan11g120200 [Vigna angularis]
MTSSSGKRIKTLGIKERVTKRKEKEQFYSNKFRIPAHERYFPAVEGRRLLIERKSGKGSNVSLSRPCWKELTMRMWSEPYVCLEGTFRGTGQSAPPPHQPRTHRRAPPPAQEPVHDVAPFQMRDMYYSLLDSRLAVVYRGEEGLLRTLTSSFLERQFMSQDDFAAYVAWPANLAQEGDSLTFLPRVNFHIAPKIIQLLKTTPHGGNRDDSREAAAVTLSTQWGGSGEAAPVDLERWMKMKIQRRREHWREDGRRRDRGGQPQAAGAMTKRREADRQDDTARQTGKTTGSIMTGTARQGVTEEERECTTKKTLRLGMDITRGKRKLLGDETC